MKLKTIKTPSELYRDIEAFIERTGLNYLDAIIAYGEENDIEVEILASLIKKQPKLKSKLENTCEELNLLEKLSD